MVPKANEKVYVPLWRLWPRQPYFTVSYPDELALHVKLPLDFIRLGGDNTLRFVQDVAQMLVEGEEVLRDSANIDEALDLENEPKEALYRFIPVNPGIVFEEVRGPESAQSALGAPPGYIESDDRTESEPFRRTDDQSNFREGLLIRDGSCPFTYKRGENCEAAHLVPVARTDVYEKLLGTAAPYEVSFGLLLSPNLHRSYDRYNGRYSFHCFDYTDDEAAHLHGKSFAPSDMRVSKEDGESAYPDPELCRWHYRQCVLMRVRGYAVNMAIAPISIDLDPLTGLPRGLDSAPFVLEDHPVGESGRKLKVAMIGAGFSGIIAGIRIDQHLKDHVELDIFEKNHSVGGTWFENNYPGLCCDIPAHCYSLTFEPNHRWTNFYASGREILAYLQRVSAKYKLERFLRFGHKLTAAKWNEKTSQWHLSFDIVDEKDNKVGEKEAVVDAVIQGMGGLSRWDWPNIPGIKEFKGRLLHSAAYETKAEDEKDKTVAVIGSGSSAIQIVPALQPHAKRVDNYVRGSAWIATPFASTELLKRKPDANNYTFTEEEKERFEKDPAYYQEFRKSMEKELNAVHGVTLKGSELQTGAVAAFRELMEKKLETKPEIAKVFIPTFAVGCRRLTPGPGYLEALTSDNVDFVSTGIKRITESGIETNDGKHREYDTIVSATGFDTSFRPRVPIVGKNGSDVRDLWEDIPSSYLSMFIGPDHPNYFIINGPNSSLGSGSLLVVFEKEVDYIVKCLGKMVRESVITMAAKQEAVNDWQEYVHTYFQKTVFSTKCRSWYKRGLEEGPVTALWPGSALHAIKTIENPRWEDFEYTHLNKNRLAWLGNGWSKTELEGGDTAYYLDEIDYPPVPK
ncbi:hypothetical protein NBRC10513v2_003890 [Rhodotorula toruloides]